MALVPMEAVRAMVLEAACPAPLPVVEVGIADAVGCVVAEPVTAAEDVPPWANTGMDGIAVRAADTAGATDEHPVALRLTGFLAAGADPTAFHVGPGEAVRIMTGAPIPSGADAVVMVERTSTVDDDPGTVRAHVEAAPGEHVRAAGGDVAAGAVVFAAGAEITPAGAGVLASIGRSTVRVHRRPRVGVLSTGDELVSDDRPLQPGQIRESNRPALLALCRQSGFEAVDLGTAVDEAGAIRTAIRRGAAECDAMLTSGGVSMGDVDLVKVVLDELSGGSFHWLQVAIKPAKPFAFGLVDGTPILGLPGNPVSSLVSFECFARPALRALAGHPAHRLGRRTVTATAADGLARRPDGKLHLVRVALTDVATSDHPAPPEARSSGDQGSNVLTAMALADALALVPDGDGIPAGGPVTCWLL
jgi:molybdopterin molybdotransferase